MPNVFKSYADLVAFFAENKMPHRVDQEQQILDMATQSGPLSGVLNIRWEKQLPFVQLLHALYFDVPADRIPDLEKACLRLNNALPLPGFGIDYDSRTLYYRLVLPMFEEGMAALTFQQMVLACINNTRDALAPFKKVIDGESGDKIIDVVRALVPGGKT